MKRKRIILAATPFVFVFLILGYYQLFYCSPQVNSNMFKLKTTLTAHTGNIWAAKYSPDGKLLASGSVDSTVILWRMSDGRIARKIKQPAGITNLAYSPDGNFIATTSYDGIARLWEVNTGAMMRKFSANDQPLWSVDISPDGKTIACAGEDKTIRIWELASGKLVKELKGHSLNIWAVKYSPDGNQLASGSFDSGLKIWDARSGALLHNLTQHSQAIVDLAFSHDGKLLVTTSDDKTIKLWHMPEARLVRNLAVPEHIQAVAFSPDDRYLLTGGRDKPMIGEFLQNIFGNSKFNKGVSARLWDVASGKLLQTYRHHSNDVNDVSYSPNGLTIALASEDNTVELWAR